MFACFSSIGEEDWRRYKAQYEEVKGQLDQLQEAVAKEKAATPQPDPEMEAKINSLEDEVNRQKEVGLCVDICPLIQGKKSTLPGEKSVRLKEVLKRETGMRLRVKFNSLN